MLEKLENAKKIFEFLQIAGKLKKTYRFSEVEVLKNTESSADHTWRLSLMSFILADELKLGIDKEKALKLSIIHDIAESITGDIDYRKIYTNQVSTEYKKNEELKAIKLIAKRLPKKLGEEIYTLWDEYEKETTLEAKYVKALDKIEAILTLIEAGSEAFDMPELVIKQLNKANEICPPIEELILVIKEKIKKEFITEQIYWK